jgi:hypothetical protein
MDWESIKALLEAIHKTFGVAPLSFFLVSLAGTFVLAGVRAALKKKEFTEEWWYKLALTGCSILLGVGLAFLAWPTPLYDNVPNAATIAYLGIFNGLLSMGCWQLIKYLPNVSQLVTGKARLTLSPPAPAEKPKDEKAADEEKPEEDEDAPEVEEADEESSEDEETPEDDKPEEG